MSVQLVARELGARGSRTATAGPDPAGAPTQAAVEVLRSVPAWWSRRALTHGLSGRWLDVFQAVSAPRPEIDFALDEAWTPSDPISGHALGLAYVEALDAGVRSRHGRHYTPADLAERVWTSARSALGFGVRARPLPGLVRDPAAGGGALLLPPLREHLSASASVDPSVVLAGLPQRIEGIDTDPHAAWLAAIILAAEALPVLARVPETRREPLPGLVRVGDGLAYHSPARVVVMNPPYGRVRLDAAERERFAHLIKGHANLYGLFMGHALDSLDDSGVLSALVPTSFTAGAYFESLREVLTRDACLKSMTWVSDRGGTFSGVLQETCIATFSKRQVRRTAIAVANGAVHPVATVATPRTSGPWLLPRRADDAPVAAVAAAMPNTLRSLGWRASTGPLVWNRRRDDIASRPARDRHKIVWAADIVTGEVLRHPSRDQLRYLRVHGVRDERVMVLTEPAVLVQRTTAPEQTRRLVVADLDERSLEAWGGSAVVENHVNVLRPTTSEPKLDRARLALVLSTVALDRVMRSTAGSVAVSAYELGSLRFPADDVLKAWSSLEGDELVSAVAESYRDH